MALVNIFLYSDAISATYDATGKWNYTRHSILDNCDFTFSPIEPTPLYIFQKGDTFFIYGRSNGTVNGSIYTYSYEFLCINSYDCDNFTQNTSITLTSENSGNGIVDWRCEAPYDGGYTCSGGYQITLTKEAQAEPVYDVNGKWEIDTYAFYEPRYLVIRQAGNKIAATDDQGQNYAGYVDGTILYTASKVNAYQFHKTSV